MATRTTNSQITFQHPFKLNAFNTRLDAGTYRLVTDEEEIHGLSFLAYRRIATMLHIPAISVHNGRHQVIDVDPQELSAALEADGNAAKPDNA